MPESPDLSRGFEGFVNPTRPTSGEVMAIVDAADALDVHAARMDLFHARLALLRLVLMARAAGLVESPRASWRELLNALARLADARRKEETSPSEEAGSRSLVLLVSPPSAPAPPSEGGPWVTILTSPNAFVRHVVSASVGEAVRVAGQMRLGLCIHPDGPWSPAAIVSPTGVTVWSSGQVVRYPRVFAVYCDLRVWTGHAADPSLHPYPSAVVTEGGAYFEPEGKFWRRVYPEGQRVNFTYGELLHWNDLLRGGVVVYELPTGVWR